MCDVLAGPLFACVCLKVFGSDVILPVCDRPTRIYSVLLDATTLSWELKPAAIAQGRPEVGPTSAQDRPRFGPERPKIAQD